MFTIKNLKESKDLEIKRKNILILGFSKTGTTALYYKLLNSLPANTKGLFEPKQFVPELEDDKRPLLAKVIVDSYLNNDIDSFNNFDKKILIIRDPRDRLISMLLYFLRDRGILCDETLIKYYFELIKKKQENPDSVSIIDLVDTMKMIRNIIKKDFKVENPLDTLINLQNKYQDLFIVKYEDFVDGKIEELEDYLGFKLAGSSEVSVMHKRVERTKSYGDWKNWFTEKDIEYFKPKFKRFIEYYGYEPDWRLNNPKVILPEYRFEYVKKITNENRKQNGLSEIDFDYKLPKNYNLKPIKNHQLIKCDSYGGLKIGVLLKFFKKKKESETKQNYLYAIYHMSKTGGTTLRLTLEKNLKNNEFIRLYVDSGYFSSIEHIESYLSGLLEKEKDFIRVVIGHEVFEEFLKHFNRDIRRIVFLRNPFDRTISLYNHVRRAQDNKDSKERKPSWFNVISDTGDVFTFKEWYNQYKGLLKNFYIRELVRKFSKEKIGKSPQELIREAKKILEDFYFVGITENPEDFLFVYDLFGIKNIDTFKRENVSKNYFSGDSYGEAKEIILSDNSDMELYEYAVELNKKFKIDNEEYKKMAADLNIHEELVVDGNNEDFGNLPTLIEIDKNFLENNNLNISTGGKKYRWWLVYGLPRTGTSLMTTLIATNSKKAIYDWCLRDVLKPLESHPHIPPFFRVEFLKSLSENILKSTISTGGDILDFVFKQAGLTAEEYSALVEMWGEPERKIYCLREPSGFIASTIKKFDNLQLEKMKKRYVEHLERVYDKIGGDIFEYKPDLTIEDYMEFLRPLVIENQIKFNYTGSKDDKNVTKEMTKAYEDFKERNQTNIFSLYNKNFSKDCTESISDIKYDSEVLITNNNKNNNLGEIVPEDFDWKIYLDNYLDLRKNGIDNEQKAKRHWLNHGRSEGRIYTLQNLKNTLKLESETNINNELPIPSPQDINDLYIGRDDFRKIGEIYLKSFIEIGGLKSTDKVLDVGCGIGRMAIPLTKYLDNGGAYEGFDIVPKGINWCKENITSKYSNFKFNLANIYNKCYNPSGTQKASDYRFPYPDNNFDFVFLTSVFTHMLPEDMENYFSEISRVLKKSGVCYITYFIKNAESSILMNNEDSKINFNIKIDNYYTTNIDCSERVIMYEEDYILGLYKKYGFELVIPIQYGGWCGRKKNEKGQDIIIAIKK